MPPMRHTDRASGDSIGWAGRFVSDDTPQWARDHINSLDAYGGTGGLNRGRGVRVRRGYYPTRAMNARNFRASRLREELAARENGADDLGEQGGIGGQAVASRQARPMTAGGGELVRTSSGDVDMDEGGDNNGGNGENVTDVTAIAGPAPYTPAAARAMSAAGSASSAPTPRTSSPVNLLLAQSRALNRSVEAVAADNEALRASIHLHDVEKETWQADRDAMETENERLTTQIQDQTHLDQEVVAAQQQVENLEAQLATASTAQRRLEAQIQGLDVEKQRLQSQNSTLNSTVDDMNKRRDIQIRTISILEGTIQEQRDAVAKTEQRRLELHSAHSRIQQLDGEKAELQKANANLHRIGQEMLLTGQKVTAEYEAVVKAKQTALEEKERAVAGMEIAMYGRDEASRDRDAAIQERDESLKKQAETQAAKDALEKQLHVVQREKAQASEKLAFIKTAMAAL